MPLLIGNKPLLTDFSRRFLDNTVTDGDVVYGFKSPFLVK